MNNLEELRDKHKGQIGFAIGAGPSLHFRNLDLIKDKVTIAGNSGIVKATWCKYFIADDWDVSNWSYYHQDLLDSKCDILLYEENMKKYSSHLPEDRIYWFNHREGSYNKTTKKYTKESLKLTKDFDIISARTVIGSAVHFLYIMGCNPIVLLGCDSSYSDNYRYFWQYDGEKKPHRLDGKPVFCKPSIRLGKDKVTDTHGFEFLQYWNQIAEAAKEVDLKIYNASQGVLECFEKASIEDILKKYGE